MTPDEETARTHGAEHAAGSTDADVGVGPTSDAAASAGSGSDTASDPAPRIADPIVSAAPREAEQLPTVPGQPLTLRVGAGAAAAGGSLFDRIGGSATFDRLVREFYVGVRADPVIWPMYPADDLEGAIWRLSSFLQQYWGGPGTYSAERGHPRLRMRHMPFRVTPEARERWLTHMRAAVDALELAPMDDAELWAYLDRAAHAMTNSFD